jgi:Flp pilus assembly protein TadB
MKKIESPATELKKKIITEARIMQELQSLQKSAGGSDMKKIQGHVKSLELYLGKTKNEIMRMLDEINMSQPLPQAQPQKTAEPANADDSSDEFIYENPGESLKETKYREEDKEDEEKSSSIEKSTLRRLKKKEEKKAEKKEKKPSKYLKTASKTFADFSRKLIAKGYFKSIEKDLIKANLEFVPASYIALILYSTMWAFIGGAIITAFFLFFNISPNLPIITLSAENMATRLMKVFWIFILAPLITFIAMYTYPSLEKKSVEAKINQELPFATIHMAAISGSMIDPSKIFEIIITTGEYPYVSREFTKLLNQINVYGYDLVGGLRNMAFNSPSRKLADLFNSLATAITSGGDLPDFFDKRANSLLFENKLEREKQAKAAETFMDIYISVVIAAPMILMLLLMMLKIGGLGLGLSTGTITITMILGVVAINIFFLAFLHLRQPAE